MNAIQYISDLLSGGDLQKTEAKVANELARAVNPTAMLNNEQQGFVRRALQETEFFDHTRSVGVTTTALQIAAYINSCH